MSFARIRLEASKLPVPLEVQSALEHAIGGPEAEGAEIRLRGDGVHGFSDDLWVHAVDRGWGGGVHGVRQMLGDPGATSSPHNFPGKNYIHGHGGTARDPGSEAAHPGCTCPSNATVRQNRESGRRLDSLVLIKKSSCPTRLRLRRTTVDTRPMIGRGTRFSGSGGGQWRYLPLSGI